MREVYLIYEFACSLCSRLCRLLLSIGRSRALDEDRVYHSAFAFKVLSIFSQSLASFATLFAFSLIRALTQSTLSAQFPQVSRECPCAAASASLEP
jgi:hypothetical protein